MEQVTRLWLIRHGEPEASSRGRVYGRLDLGLSPRGTEQAHAVAALLRDEPLAAICASPRRRTADTARPLAEALGLPVVTDERFREIDFGELEGRPYEEIRAERPEFFAHWMAHPTEVQFPGGESFAQMRERVLAGARQLLEAYAGQTVALFTHGGVNRILLAAALEMPHAAVFHLGQDFAAVNLIRYLSGFAVVEKMNATPHNGR
jgi:alpha-ribazole phosphatase